MLDDFGAGLQHGELSHRIQWYAIIGYLAAQPNDPRLSGHRPLDLFKAINTGRFGRERLGTTMWGRVLDAGTAADAPSYSAPGTLNRDLLDAAGYEPTAGDPGNARRSAGGTYTGPSREALGHVAPIGRAVMELRALRVRQAAEAFATSPPDAAESGQWATFGVPPHALVSAIERDMLGSGRYRVTDQGEVASASAFSAPGASTTWRVLQERLTDDGSSS